MKADIAVISLHLLIKKVKIGKISIILEKTTFAKV